jgi:DNA mismatch repair protein MutL
MSNRIKILPDHIANQIAAGEVIQRPCSVVKELVENAVDAGSTKIQVIIKDSGKTLIQVIDNGEGMSSEDAITCFERHATSKIESANDLFSLTTKGFRGEALSSIASIAQVILKTKQVDQETGTEIHIEGSKIVTQTDCVVAIGTSFEVKNLFFNIPARRNFLKSDAMEFRHIEEEFERVALAHPSCSFTIHHNNQEVCNLPIANLRKRIVDVLGKTTNDRLVPIEEKTDIVSIHGYVLKPEFARKTRGEQYFFVNNRFFKDHYFNHAVNRAFDGLIQPKFFPGYFIFFEVNPAKLDVNIHPTKTEIKFEEDKFIYSILLSSIRQALGKYNVSPTLDFEQETAFDVPMSFRNQPAIEPVIRVNPDFNPFQPSTSSSNKSGSSGLSPAIRAQGFGQTNPSADDWQNFYKIEEDQEINQNHLIEPTSIETVKEFLVKDRLVLTPSKSGFMLIDRKRAQERITYDELMEQFVNSPIHSQQLLFPYDLELSKNEKIVWESNRSLLERFGFQYEVHSNQLILNGVPSCVQDDSIHACVDSINETIGYKEVDKGEIAHFVVLSIAKSVSLAALKNKIEPSYLIERLFQCQDHQYSPTGKRILNTLTLEELKSKL